MLSHCTANDPRFTPLGVAQTSPDLSSNVWVPWANNSGLTVNTSSAPWISSVSNPAPYIFPNGTTLLFHSAAHCPPNWGALAPECIGLARADSWEGPFTELFPLPITAPESEDPFVWRDPRGNFHLHTNVNT